MNPKNQKGKLIVILRLGRNNMGILDSLISYKKYNSLNFIWMCDPMHGNTYTAGDLKTRKVDDIKNEIIEVN